MQGAAYGNHKTAINRPEESITTRSCPVLASSGMMVGGDRLTGSYASQLFHRLALAPPVEERR
jgi:hypothetical protein